MCKKFKIEENQLDTLCYDTVVDSFHQSPTSHKETKHSTWALHHISWMFGLVICQFIITLVQIWCSCSMPVFLFLECWSLSSFFVMTIFFYCGESAQIHHNKKKLRSVTVSCCGCDSGLNWTFEMCSACLNILYLTVCVVIFLAPNVVKVLQRMLNFSDLCIHFSSIYSVYTFPVSVWVFLFDFFHVILLAMLQICGN